MAYTTINKSSEYFNTKLYTGDNTATSYTGVGFQPDFIWIKDRSQAADHTLIDSVRGVKKVILSNSTAAEGTDGATQGLNSFDSDGFTLGTNSNVGSTNNTGDNYVAWNWLGGGTGVSNTDGDITSTVSANTTSGFSIVKYTGNGTQSDQEIGTGLSTELKFVIAKPLEAGGTTSSWVVYVNGITDAQDNCLLLESTSGLITGASGGTPNKGTTAGNLLIKAGTSSNNNLNNSGTNYIAYCFAEKKGFSKFGSYTGNGNVDGTFVYTGFKPAFVMIKVTNGVDNWFIFDNRRSTSGGNVVDDYLYPNLSNAEGGTDILDFLSNGFKLRTTDGGQNGSSNYIYMAFAENPLVGTNAVPATAR